uniref:Endonuclease/exonuclease/phosphatase domain-containing protein n=3 Tax=Meloidogyne TaxID=189290 RepID=A0A6V7VNB6_MELEN|nr:unnamed protein product [Meloidogyne enterolobii]
MEVVVMNRDKNGKKVWLPGTILSKFEVGYKVKVPRLRAIVSHEEWQISPKSMKSDESRSKGSTHGQPRSQLESSSNLKDASTTTTQNATKSKDEPMQDNSQILHSTSYSIVRCDRGSRGGGACILVDNIVPFSPVKTPKNKNSDVVAIDIYSPKFDKFRIITVYRPTTNENLNDFQEFLETLSYLISINHNYIIVGDFNFPNLIWKNNIPLALNHKSPSEKLFIEFVENFNLIQEISSPTRQNNYLDLLFSPSTSRVAKNITINAPFKNSDHNTIEFNLNFNCFPKEPEFIYDFHNADYNQINNILIGLNWNTLFINCTNVDSQYTLFLEIIHQIIQNFIPLKTINKDFAKFPKHIQKMISYKNLLWKNINKPAIREKYILNQQKIDKEISHFFKNREISKFNDSRSRFHYIGAFLKSKKTKIPIFNINNQFSILAKDKAECLAKQSNLFLTLLTLTPLT